MERVAIVGGLRTPFVKAHTSFSKHSMQQLAEHVLRELVKKYEIDPGAIDEVVLGAVLLDPTTPNWAREIVLRAGLPKTVYAHSVSNNCISGLVAINGAKDRIALGMTKIAIAGGTESMSNPALLFSKKKSKLFLKLFTAKSVAEKLSILSKNPFQLFPTPPSVKEPSTGLTMGEHMEITAKQLGIGRREQDEIALKSHLNAWNATEKGYFSSEIAPLDGVKTDLMIRKDTSLEKLSRLSPVFDTSGKGSLTAGNSSPLTDGASMVLLMSESQAKAEGREILAFIRSYEYAAIDANDGLLMAPAVCVPKMLHRVGLTLADFDLIEIHEAFAAQVLANCKAWEEGLMAQSIGKVDSSKVNTLGGSISIGHPFAATGGRIVTSLANEMKRRGVKRGLISICAAGAMAGAMILERD